MDPLTSAMINTNSKFPRIMGKFNNFIYTDWVNFGMIMSATDHCIPQHSLKHPSILDCTKYYAICVDLPEDVDLVQKFVFVLCS